MVLINIGSLSENELRNIASQEDLEDWETLSRDELIDALEDLYDEDENRLNEEHSGSSRKKFVNTLTDVQSANDLSLPGTEPLPESYNETSIHMILKDMNWAYVCWSLSSQLETEFEDGGAELVLRNVRFDVDGNEVASYDIEISPSDDNWTVELPHLGYSYQVCLVLRKEGEEKVLCKSSPVSTTESWLSTHPEKLRDNVTFKKMFSSLVLKGGTVLENNQVRELIAKITDDGADAEVAR